MSGKKRSRLRAISPYREFQNSEISSVLGDAMETLNPSDDLELLHHFRPDTEMFNQNDEEMANSESDLLHTTEQGNNSSLSTLSSTSTFSSEENAGVLTFDSDNGQHDSQMVSVSRRKCSKTASNFKATKETRNFKTFFRTDFKLKGDLGKYFDYVGHNVRILKEWEKEMNKPEECRKMSKISKCGFTVYCRKCPNNKLVRATDSNPERLLNHLKTHSLVPESGKSSRGRLFLQADKYTLDNPTQQEYARRCLKFIVESGSPFNAIDFKSWSDLVTFLHPSIRPLTARTFLRRVHAVEKLEVRPFLLRFLRDFSECGLIVDGWSTRQNESIICTQVVVMTKDCELVQKTIAAEPFEGKHDYTNIQEVIISQIRAFKLEKKVLYIISDKGSNFKKALNFVNSEHLALFHPDYEQALCATHGVHNVILKAVRNVVECDIIIERVTVHVKFIKNGLDTSAELKKKSKLRLIKAVKTRWNSYYVMLNRYAKAPVYKAVCEILAAKKKLRAANDYSRQVPEAFTLDEYDLIQEIINVMEPVALATTKLQGDSFLPTEVVPTIIQLHRRVRKVPTSFQPSYELQQRILFYLEKDFADTLNSNQLLTMTLLNPSYKSGFFRIYAADPGFSENPFSLPELESVVRMVEMSLPTEEISNPIPANTQNYDDDLRAEIAYMEGGADYRNEIRRYLETNFALECNISDPNYVRNFWKNHQHDMPKLFRLFKKTFIRRVSTASVERSFRRLSLLNSPTRPYSIKTLGDLLMVYENLSIFDEDEITISELREAAEFMEDFSLRDCLEENQPPLYVSEDGSEVEDIDDQAFDHDDGESSNNDVCLANNGQYVTGSHALSRILIDYCSDDDMF